jgi:hypothetical protein
MVVCARCPSPLEVQLFASVYRAGGYIDNFVYSFQRVTSQSPFTNIDADLPGSNGLTRLYGSGVAGLYT